MLCRIKNTNWGGSLSEFSIKPFESISEVIEYGNLYNDLNNRSTLDHNEVININDMVNAYQEHGFLREQKSTFVVIDSNDQLLGTIGFEKISSFEFVLGYRLLKLEYMGKGLMTKILQRFVDDVFTKYPLINRLTLKIHEENIPSKKVALKCGFTYEGTLRDGYKYRSRMVGFEIYSLLRREYRK